MPTLNHADFVGEANNNAGKRTLIRPRGYTLAANATAGSPRNVHELSPCRGIARRTRILLIGLDTEVTKTSPSTS